MFPGLILICVILFGGLQITHSSDTWKGKASYYAGKFHGQKTASGEPFNMDDYTAAHRTLPFGTYLEVTHAKTRRKVLVRVNDRGPFIKTRMLDLSRAAALRLGDIKHGVFSVWVREMEFRPLDSTTTALYWRQPVMDCLGNIEKISGGAVRVWESAHLVHALYIANDLYVNENIDRVLLCGNGEGTARKFTVVVDAPPGREVHQELKTRLGELGFYGIRPFASD